MMMSPMGLNEDAVDLFKFDLFGLVADSFEETGEAKVSNTS